MHRANNAQTTRCLLFAHGTRGRNAAALIRHSRVSAAAVETVQLAAQALLYTRPVVRVLQGSGLTTTHCSKCCWRQPRTALSAMCAFVRHKPSAAHPTLLTPVMQQRTLHVASQWHTVSADSADRCLCHTTLPLMRGRTVAAVARSRVQYLVAPTVEGAACLLFCADRWGRPCCALWPRPPKESPSDPFEWVAH